MRLHLRKRNEHYKKPLSHQVSGASGASEEMEMRGSCAWGLAAALAGVCMFHSRRDRSQYRNVQRWDPGEGRIMRTDFIGGFNHNGYSLMLLLEVLESRVLGGCNLTMPCVFSQIFGYC